MFWRFGGYATISSIDSILDKPDVTLEELLDESDLIQELKQQNSKLLEFLREETVLQKLLNYVIAEKSTQSPHSQGDNGSHEDDVHDKDKDKTHLSGGGISFFGKGKLRSQSKSHSHKDSSGETEQERREAQRKKYAYVSCEVLSSEIWSIIEALLEQQDHLRTFWQYLYRPAPLDPLQAGYFTKVNETLFDKKTQSMLAFFTSLEGIVPAMLQHVDCPMIMDLLLKIISLEKLESGVGVVDWLQSQNLITLLLDYLSPEHSSATQTSAGDFLKAIITISANATTQDQAVIGPNELTRQLVSEPCVKLLIEDMLRGGNPLTVGVGIVIEVIRKNNSDYDVANQVGPEPKTSDPIYLGTLLRQFAVNVPNFMHLIRSRSASKPNLKAAFGGSIEPLGSDRFKTCELMAELLHCSNMGLLNERGAEDEVRRRDAERDRLKAEGKLAASRAPTTAGANNSYEDFGSSVDSHGFHHAERPSDDEMDEKTNEVRRLEVQNVSDDDGFEKVNAPSTDDLPSEVTFDLNEFHEQHAIPTLRPLRTDFAKDHSSMSSDDVEIPRPLSPLKHQQQPIPHFDPPPRHAEDSPISSEVTVRIDKLDVDEDSIMTEFGEDPSLADDGEESVPDFVTDHEGRFEDKPAPLFSRDKSTNSETDKPSEQADEQLDIDQSTATLQEAQPIPQAERAAYEVEADGSPVVGDLLKIQFVEHRVVPTILDFFFRFPWNNFLHNVVYDVVQQVFNGTLERGYNRTLAFDLFTKVEPHGGLSISELGLVSSEDITQRILNGQQASDVSQAKQGIRLGYMGHLTLIAEEVCKFGSRHSPEYLDPTVLERVSREEWVQYVEGVLTETRDRDNAVLGGVRPQDSVGTRSVGLGGGGGGGPFGGFSAGAANALASAGITSQDSDLGTEPTTFEINSGPILSEFGGDESDDADEEMQEDDPGPTGMAGLNSDDNRRGGQFSDDEQPSYEASVNQYTAIPKPLSKPPSRARRQLAERLAMRKRAAEANESSIISPIDENDRNANGASEAERFPALFSSGGDEDDDRQAASFDSNSSSSSEELDAADFVRAAFGMDVIDQTPDTTHQAMTLNKTGSDEETEAHSSNVRPGVDRPITKQATPSRRLLDDEDDDQHRDAPKEIGQHSRGYAIEKDETSSSEEEDLVEIRALRAG